VRDPNLDIRRPDLLGVRRTGTVRWWKSEKGYGRITAGRHSAEQIRVES
jgi:hypothetical protein